jgi:small-conductance mechanosensitive channel
MDWFWLFDSGPFLTRAHCGVWPAWLTAAYVTGNLLTALAYFTIPAALLVYRHRRRELAGGVPLKYQKLLAWGAAFILLCGLTHVSDVLVFAWAPYRLYTALYLATGLVSLRFALLLPALVRESWDVVPVEMLIAAREQAHTKAVSEALMRAVAEEKADRMEAQLRELEEIAWRESAADRLARVRKLLRVNREPVQ